MVNFVEEEKQLTLWLASPQEQRRTLEELSKELRQQKLQQFIQQRGGLQQEHKLLLLNAGILEEVAGC